MHANIIASDAIIPSAPCHLSVLQLRTKLLENQPLHRPACEETCAEWQLECNLFHGILASRKNANFWQWFSALGFLSNATLYVRCALPHPRKKFHDPSENFGRRQTAPSRTTFKLNLASRFFFLAVTCSGQSSTNRGKVCVDGVIKWLYPHRYHSVHRLHSSRNNPNFLTSRLSSHTVSLKGPPHLGICYSYFCVFFLVRFCSFYFVCCETCDMRSLLCLCCLAFVDVWDMGFVHLHLWYRNSRGVAPSPFGVSFGAKCGYRYLPICLTT